jgi:ubiquinone biosynthesis protein
VLERIHGIKIDDVEALDAAGHDRSEIARNAARIIVKEVLDEGFFHADPHPGNFVVMSDGAIGAMDFGMVGYLSESLQTDLIRLYIAIVQLDEEAIIDQFIRMGAAEEPLDRTALRQDLARLMRRYYGLPLGEVRAREVMEETMPLIFRHHLHLPSDLWLLGKTLAMMEGVALKLDPDFDIVSFSRPYVRRFMTRMLSPRQWGLPLFKSVTDWAEFSAALPRVGTRLLTQAERGELEVTIQHKGLEKALTQLNRLANRLSLSVLLAAFILGLALLVPAFNLGEQLSLATVVVIAGFLGASVLGLWLIFSIWRSGS